MLKFFRKIRLNLLLEDDPKKYLKYAVGEILLVVIGILLALQINNWNENQIMLQQERVHLKNLKIDLETQVSSLDSYIQFQDLIIENSQAIINHYNQNAGFYEMDTIYQLLNDLTVRTTFINNNTTLSELIGSGEINLIRNVPLKRKLLELNQSIKTFMNITQNNNTYLIDLLIVPIIIENSNYGILGNSDAMKRHLSSKYGKRERVNFNMNKNVQSALDKAFSDPTLSLELINKVAFRYTLASSQKKGDMELRQDVKDILIDLNKEFEIN